MIHPANRPHARRGQPLPRRGVVTARKEVPCPGP